MKIRCAKRFFKNMLLLIFIIANSIKAITKTSNAKQITTTDVYNNNLKLTSNSIDNDCGNDDDEAGAGDDFVKQLKLEGATTTTSKLETTQTTTTAENAINLILITTTTSRGVETPSNIDIAKYNESMLIVRQKLIMTTGGIPISGTKPEHFNKNSLQQQKLLKPKTTTSTIQQRHYKDNKDDEQYTLDNKHPPCDYIEHEIVNENTSSNNHFNISSRSIRSIGVDNVYGNLFKSPQIASTAKGYKPLASTSNSVNSIENNSNSNSNGSVSNAFTSSSTTASPSMMTTMTTTSTTFNVARNGFRDKINISNQRNEFSNVDDDSSTSKSIKHYNITVQQQKTPQLQLHRNIRTTKLNTSSSDDVESSFFEQVELLESNLSPDEQHELLLHRRKRYLLFPEGSSFQLVFDLIIGVVDYTSYAILGITCSVAWELPSKPPSEIIENFRDKLNEGSFGLQRRNDTIENNELQYVNTKPSNFNTKQMPTAAAVEVAPMKFANFENDENVWKPQPVSNYYNKLNVKTTEPTATSYYGSSSSSSSSSSNYYKSASNNIAAARGDNFAKTQRKTLNEKEVPTLQSSRWYSYNQPNRDYTMFYNNEKPNTKYYSNKYKNLWNFNDKRKYVASVTDWHRKKQMHASSNNSSADRFIDNVGNSSDDDYMADRFEPYQHKQQTNYAGDWQQKNNWWQHNKQRLQTKWHDKQQATWAKYVKENVEGPTPKKPITDYATPYYNNDGYTRTGRQRKILTTRPKHRIYPVFGRKKRSLKNDEKLPTKLELELERIHLREQLQSRQKLYGKIEQVFKTRGHNGTECVLRALCETGQRQYEHEKEQQQFHHYHHDDHHRSNRQPHSTIGQHREPQSFITELLRAIFALPRDIVAKRSSRSGVDFKNAGTVSVSDSAIKLELQQKHQQQKQREFESHISWHYRAAHTYDGNCAVRFADCKLSIWDDAELDNGFGSGSGYGSVADTFGQTFKM